MVVARVAHLTRSPSWRSSLAYSSRSAAVLSARPSPVRVTSPVVGPSHPSNRSAISTNEDGSPTGWARSSCPHARSSRLSVSVPGSTNPFSYLDNVGFEVPARSASSDMVRPAAERASRISCAAIVTHQRYQITQLASTEVRATPLFYFVDVARLISKARGGGLEPPMSGPEPDVLPITPSPKGDRIVPGRAAVPHGNFSAHSPAAGPGSRPLPEQPTPRGPSERRQWYPVRDLNPCYHLERVAS